MRQISFTSLAAACSRQATTHRASRAIDAPVRRLLILLDCSLAVGLWLMFSTAEAAPDFSAVYRLFDERCIECHAIDDYEAGLILETYDGLMKGGETGAAIVPGRSAESLLVKYLRGEVEKDGKKKFMPPGKREKLSADDITLIEAWIDDGAKPPAAGLTVKRELRVPKVAPKTAPRRAVTALAFSEKQKLIAVGRYGTVELLAADSRATVRRLEGHAGNVNALSFSADGAQLFAASGENALSGEVRQWNVADGRLIRTIAAHRDTLYALALSPDGATLATGGYDQQIKLWNVADGTERKTLRGHNGAVFALAFRPDGKLLASASADRTVKLWDTAAGQRRDTLSQPLAEQFTLAWSPDGTRLAVAGADNRIRIYEVSAEAKETTNPLLVARFAHEGALSRLVWSRDGKTIASVAQDGTLKLWNVVPASGEMRERAVVEKLPDWPSALTFLANDKAVAAGRLDGALEFFDAASGKILPPPPAKVASIDPRGVQRMTGGTGSQPVGRGVEPASRPAQTTTAGTPAPVLLRGSNLANLRAVMCSDPRVRIEFADSTTSDEALLYITADPSVPRGLYDVSAVGADGKHAGTVKLFVDDLPQIDLERALRSGEPTARTALPLSLPAGVWGALPKPGDSVHIAFVARAGQTLVFDLAAKSLGSKADAVLTLLDPDGKVMVAANDFDGTGDPFIAATIARDGRHTIVVSDAQFAGSPDHFFRLDAGELPFVTGCYPLGIAANREDEVELTGFNLPNDCKIKLPAAAPGEIALPIDPEKFRARRGFKVLVNALANVAEAEPNDDPAHATPFTAPAANAGRIGVPGDIDLFKFDAKKGSAWAIETHAAQRGSPIDTKIEVLDANGKPIERVLLQAVRDSAIAFRGFDSINPGDARIENWREMELNEFLWMNGEVVKLFRAPEGPDSGFALYQNNGARRTYFGTTASAHALDEPCYIVQPHPPGTRLVSNGLPVFTIHHTNDDDGERKAGSDSRLLFTAPADGSYLVRVTDSRGLGGGRFAYQLVVREAREDFSVRLDTGLTLNAGSGQSFTVTADRRDGFDGDITVEIAGIPDGYKVSSPLVVQAGHLTARGTLVALPGAKALDAAEWAKVKVSARAQISGQSVAHDAGNFGPVGLGKAPQLYVALEPAAPGDTLEKVTPPTHLQAQDPAKPFEITIAPGEIIPAWLKIQRSGANGDLRFDVENLPHGIIVDNLGLNGITLLANQNEGEIALKCASWVAEQDRLCFAVSREAGRQSSLPVLLHVRKKDGVKVLTVK
jgi:WD40 repeat protein